MKQSSVSQAETPSGYDRLRFEGSSFILVPEQVLEEVRTARAAQRNAEAEEELSVRVQRTLAQVKRARKVARAGEAKSRVSGRRMNYPAKSGSYRVLPGLMDLQKQIAEPAHSDRSADRDVNDRRKRIIEKLLELGPDRKVNMPVQWRSAIDRLEQLLPHFWQPIRTIRNALALADATSTPLRIPPILLLGPPGIGKTYFSHSVADLLCTSRGAIHFDQPGAGAQLRGSDKYWANSEPGLLFNLICMGEAANPVLLLDEVDKACVSNNGRALDQLAQLHGALEQETARRTLDTSLDIEFDASLVTYIATANSASEIGPPLLSRLDVMVIRAPDKRQGIDMARSITSGLLHRLQLEGRVSFDLSALVALAQLSPRLIQRIATQVVASAVAEGLVRIGEPEVWAEVSGSAGPRPH
jgi:ATP-dependent Lon protease